MPVDPLSLLVEALITSLSGYSREVWWHLEPAGYYMTIGRSKDKFEILLEYSFDSKAQTKERIFSATGNGQEIILPIWRALSEFYSHEYSEPEWPSSNGKDMKKLKSENG